MGRVTSQEENGSAEVVIDHSCQHIMRAIQIAIVCALVACSIAILAAAFEIVRIGVDRNEVVECNQWLAQSREFPSQFYLLKWQKEQCDAHGIFINATVK